MHEYSQQLNIVDNILQIRIDEDITKKIYAEQIKLMHDSIPTLLFINIIIGLAISYGFSDIVSPAIIISCLSLLVLMVVIRTSIYIHYKNKFDSENLKPFRLSIIIGSAFAGLIWGAIGILYFPMDNQTYQLFLLMSLFAMTGGSAFTYSLYLPGYFAYVPTILLPITIQFFFIGDKLHITLGIVSLVFLVVLTAFNIKINRNFKTTLALRFENILLVQQLKKQKEQAESANKAKSTFLAAASHDLRQPLYSLSLFTSVLDESVHDADTRKIVKQINMSVDALKSLFDALLDISKLDAGAVVADKVSFHIQPLFDKLANAFDMHALEKGLKIHWPDCTYRVTSEAHLLEQILRNYLENAIRYTESGEINVACEIKDDVMTISVSDSGIGIPEEELQNIFIEFHQVENKQRNRKNGLGLGLAIVSRTAKLLGHEISVRSTVNIGSTFSIQIRRTELDTTEQASQLKGPIYSQSDSSLLVAVVDDEESIREGLCQLLNLWQYEVVVADSGETLLSQLEKENRKPDALISDFRLANGLTGIDVIKQLNQRYAETIPALIISGDTEQDRIKTMNTGHWQVLHKPVAAAKLRAFLRSI